MVAWLQRQGGVLLRVGGWWGTFLFDGVSVASSLEVAGRGWGVDAKVATMLVTRTRLFEVPSRLLWKVPSRLSMSDRYCYGKFEVWRDLQVEDEVRRRRRGVACRWLRDLQQRSFKRQSFSSSFPCNCSDRGCVGETTKSSIVGFCISWSFPCKCSDGGDAEVERQRALVLASVLEQQMWR